MEGRAKKCNGNASSKLVHTSGVGRLVLHSCTEAGKSTDPAHLDPPRAEKQVHRELADIPRADDGNLPWASVGECPKDCVNKPPSNCICIKQAK